MVWHTLCAPFNAIRDNNEVAWTLQKQIYIVEFNENLLNFHYIFFAAIYRTYYIINRYESLVQLKW